MVGAPDETTRKRIFEIHTKKMPLSSDVDLNELAKNSDGYAGADIANVCREAAISALRKDMKAEKVATLDFDNAMAKVRPSITKDIEESYSKLKEQFTKATAKQMKEDRPSYFM